jgi:hypothetical protein
LPLFSLLKMLELLALLELLAQNGVRSRFRGHRRRMDDGGAKLAANFLFLMTVFLRSSGCGSADDALSFDASII